MTRIVILSVLVLAALCLVYGAQQKPGYGPLLREVRQALFQKRGQLRSETHFWCWEVLEQHRETICYEPPPVTKPPQPTHNHDSTTSWPHKPTDGPHKPTDGPHKPTDKPTDWPHKPTDDLHTKDFLSNAPPGTTVYPTEGHTDTSVAPSVFSEFVGAREAKGFLGIGKNIQDLHEECCWEGCDVEEVDESC